MSEPLLQINISNSEYNMDEDLVKIRFSNGNVVQINFIKLFAQSKYFRDNYKYSEAINSIKTEIEKVENEFHVNCEIIKLFFQLIQEEKVNIPLKHYRDFYILSEYFCTQKITAKLDNISQRELINDLNFTIQTLLDSDTAKNRLETKLGSKIENFLVERVNDCFKNQKFRQLSIPTICRIIDKSKKTVNHDLLFDFIFESASTRFILLKYVELHKMNDEKVKKLIKFIEEQEEETKKMYLEYIPFNILFIKNIINKYDEIFNENNQLKLEIKRLKDEKNKHEQTKIELNNIPKLSTAAATRLHIKICEAKKVLKMDLGGKSDPYVTLRLKSQDKNDAQKTQIISNTTDPIWNQEFDIIAVDPNDVLLINMYDEDTKNDKMMDELSFPVNSWPIGGPLDRREMDVKLKKKKAGRLIFEVQAFPTEI